MYELCTVHVLVYDIPDENNNINTLQTVRLYLNPLSIFRMSHFKYNKVLGKVLLQIRWDFNEIHNNTMTKRKKK